MVERRQDRQSLGNRKKRIARERLMFSQAVELGANLRIMQLQNSVARLDYGAAYFVPPTVGDVATGNADEVESTVSSDGDSGIGSDDRTDLRSGFTSDPYEYPDADAIPA